MNMVIKESFVKISLSKNQENHNINTTHKNMMYLIIFRAAMNHNDLCKIKETLDSHSFQDWSYSKLGWKHSKYLLNGLRSYFANQLNQLPFIKNEFFHIESGTYTKKATLLFCGKASERLISEWESFKDTLHILHTIEKLLAKQKSRLFPHTKVPKVTVDVSQSYLD